MGGVCDKCETAISVSRPDRVYYAGELINGIVTHEDCERHFDSGIADASILLKCYLVDTWDCGAVQPTFPTTLPTMARARKYVLFESKTLLNKPERDDSDNNKETYTFNISVPENALPTIKLSSHARIFYNLMLNKPGRTPYCRKVSVNVVPLVRLSPAPRLAESTFYVEGVKGSCSVDGPLYSLPANMHLRVKLHCESCGELHSKLLCRVETRSTRTKRTVLHCSAALGQGANHIAQSFCLSDMKMIPTFQSTANVANRQKVVAELKVDYSVEFFFRPAGDDCASDRRLCSIGVAIENCSGRDRGK